MPPFSTFIKMEENKEEPNVKLQEPGENIKPVVPEGAIVELAWRLYGMRVKHCTEINSYDDKNYHVIPEPDVENAHISGVSTHGYVLKVYNSMETQRPISIGKDVNSS